MKDSIKNRKKRFLALCLSVMMLSSVAAFAACSDETTDSSSSSSSSSSVDTTEEKDTGLVKNAGFETFDEDNAINTSVTGWTRSTSSAPSGSGISSKAASGIIDLDETAWNKLTGMGYTMKNAADAKEAEENWSKMTVKEKLAFYDAWKEANSDKKIAEELDSFYESFNIDSGDIPTFTRDEVGTHDNDAEDTKVLMIHNENPEPNASGSKTIGTGQKYTSSSTVTVSAGTSAKFSVWVKTLDLKSSSTNGTSQEAVDKGAYISLTHTVGGTTLDPLVVENINTQAMDEDLSATNGWKQYSFVLKGSSYTDSTFTIVLGLGQGGGTYRGEYVNGYAFFDDIECEVISNAKYDETTVDKELTFKDEGEGKVFDVSKDGSLDSFGLNFYGGIESMSGVIATDKVTVKATASETTGYTSLAGSNVAPWLGTGFDGSKDVTKVVTGGVKADSDPASPISLLYKNYFEGTEKFKNDDTLLLFSVHGAAYTAESSTVFTVHDYLALSFFVKTSAMEGKAGAGITLTDEFGKETSFAAIDTTTATPVEVDGVDINEGWQQCFFFVKNDTDTPKTFTLSFNFGPTTVEQGVASDSYYQGFAAFTGFESHQMAKKEYESATSGTYAKIVTIVDEDDADEKTESGFDSAKATPSTALEEGFAKLQNYTGVYSDSAYITGSGDANKDAYAYAGLLSKKNFTAADGYFSLSEKWIKSLAGDETDRNKVWTNVFGDDTDLPLLIWNDKDMGSKAYGFIGKSASVAANSYSAISVRVKGNTNAYIRLIDTDKPDSQGTYKETLSIGGNLTYWYDDEGNIWNGDPTEKSTVMAFRLQSNGLYTPNKGWDKYDSLTAAQKNAYYANFSAYELVGKNLMVADGGARHDYTNQWNGVGKNGIAFYNYDAATNTAYAYDDTTTPVIDLASVESLNTRFAKTESRELTANVAAKTDKWTYVTFYIHTGDKAKNYRLEVWNGTGNADGTISYNGDEKYVVFDTFNDGTAESNFTDLLADEDYTDAVPEEDKFKSVFSYFDTANYLRYDASLDENGYGNLYEENYTASANTEGYAYLKKVSENDYTVFADYQYAEKAVTASEIEDDADDSTEEEETESETNPWLLASSLAIAGVLILAIVSIIVRKAIVKSRKNRAHNVKSKK